MQMIQGLEHRTYNESLKRSERLPMVLTDEEMSSTCMLIFGVTEQGRGQEYRQWSQTPLSSTPQQDG